MWRYREITLFRFFQKNYFVIAIDRKKQDCKCSHFFHLDLTDLLDNKKKTKEFSKQVNFLLDKSPLAGIVNNAAVQILSSLEELDLKDFRLTLDTNLTVPLFLSKLFLNHLADNKGTIVNIGSIHAHLTKPEFISYATSKAALAGLTRTLAVDLGGKGVHVNTIQPAATYTQMLADGFIGKADSFKLLKEYHPLQRIAKPKEIALLTEFLISEKCSFITGASIDIDGGIGARLHDPE